MPSFSAFVSAHFGQPPSFVLPVFMSLLDLSIPVSVYNYLIYPIYVIWIFFFNPSTLASTDATVHYPAGGSTEEFIERSSA